MPLLCLASPKGGVGKTTLAANLACGLAGLGARVVALDLDPQNALRLHFGVPLHDGAGLMPVLRRRGAWQSALRQAAGGVRLLPYGQTDMAAALSDAAMMAGAASALTPVVRDILADPTTILIVDTPPGPSAAAAAVLPLADMLVTVLLPDATSAAVIPTVEQGRAYGASPPPGLRGRHAFVLNQVNPLSRLSRATTEAVARQLGTRLLGTISRDENVAEAIANQLPVVGYAPCSRAAQDLSQLASVVAARLADGRQDVGRQEEARRPPPMPMPDPSRFGYLVRHP
jgi:cellulose synthase operon protein YhjQ